MTEAIYTAGIDPDSPHYGHLIRYAEYGWTYRDVATVEEDDGDLIVRYDREAVDGDLVETMLVCHTCGFQVAQEDLHPDADVWYGEFTED